MSTGPHINYFGLTAYDNKATFFGDTATILPEVSYGDSLWIDRRFTWTQR